MKSNVTPNGKLCLQMCLAGEAPLVFSAILIGNGTNAGEEANALTAPVTKMKIEEIIKGAESEGGDQDFVTLRGTLSNNSMPAWDAVMDETGGYDKYVDESFRATELGIMVKDPSDDTKEVLFAYAYVSESEAILIPKSTDRIFETTQDILVYVGTVEDVSAELSKSLTTVSKSEFNEHVNNKENPHGLGKEDVGLGYVPNVSTNDQTPTYDVEIEDESEELQSGEKLTVAFRKIARAIKKILTHISDKKNPHGLKAADIDAAGKTHTHSATDVNTGILSILRGGTGAATAEEALKKLGALPITGGAVSGETLGVYNPNAKYPQLFTGHDINNRGVLSYHNGVLHIACVVDGVQTTLAMDNQGNVVIWTPEGKAKALYSEHNKPTADDVGALPISGGTMKGKLVANASDVSVAQVRNIKAGTTDLTAGASQLETGTIYFVYE